MGTLQFLLESASGILHLYENCAILFVLVILKELYQNHKCNVHH